jgi:hypothetical protein
MIIETMMAVNMMGMMARWAMMAMMIVENERCTMCVGLLH